MNANLTALPCLGLMAAIGAALAFAQQAEVRFASTECRVSFNHPRDWSVARDTAEGDSRCHLVARPTNWARRLADSDSIDVYTITIHVVARGVEVEIATSAFRRLAAGWVVLGRHDAERPAESVRGRGWTGVRGTAIQGCYRDRAYIGLCEQPTALVGTSSRSSLIVGGPQSESTFNRILETLEFQ